MSDKIKFKKNQVVWAKVKGYPWWPSVIAQIKSPDSGNEQILVNFLNEESHSTLPKDKVQDFLENYENMTKQYQQQKKKKLQEAVDMALRIAKGNSSFDDEKSKYVKRYKKRASQANDSSDSGSSSDEGGEDDDENKNASKKVGRKPGRKPKSQKGRAAQKMKSKSKQQQKNRSKNDKSDSDDDNNSDGESGSEEDETEMQETSQSKNNQAVNSKDKDKEKDKDSNFEKQISDKKHDTQKSEIKEKVIKNQEQDKNKQNLQEDKNKKEPENIEEEKQDNVEDDQEDEKNEKNQSLKNQKHTNSKISDNSNQEKNMEKKQENSEENIKQNDDEDEDEQNSNTDTQWSKKSQKKNAENPSENVETKRVTRSKINQNSSSLPVKENKKKMSISSIKANAKHDRGFKSTPSKQSEIEENQSEMEREDEVTNQSHDASSKKNAKINQEESQNNQNQNQSQTYNTRSNRSPHSNNLNNMNTANNSNNNNGQNQNNQKGSKIINISSSNFNNNNNVANSNSNNQNNNNSNNQQKNLNIGNINLHSNQSKLQFRGHKYNTRIESGKSTPSEKLLAGMLPVKKQKLENGEGLLQPFSPTFIQVNHELKDEVDNLNYMVNYSELDTDQQQLILDRVIKYFRKLETFLKDFDQKLVKNQEKIKEQQNNNEKNFDNTSYKQLENITLIKRLDKLCQDFQNLQDIHIYINFQQSNMGKMFNSLLTIFNIYKISQPLEINVKEKLVQIVKQIKILIVEQTLNIHSYKQNVEIFSHFQTEVDVLLSEQQRSGSENNQENEQFETPKTHQFVNSIPQQNNNNQINGKSSTSSVVTQNTNNVLLNGNTSNNNQSQHIDNEQNQQEEKIKKMRKKVCIKISECLTNQHQWKKQESQQKALSIEKLIKFSDPEIGNTYRELAKKTLKVLSRGVKEQCQVLLNSINNKENNVQFADQVNQLTSKF